MKLRSRLLFTIEAAYLDYLVVIKYIFVKCRLWKRSIGKSPLLDKTFAKSFAGTGGTVHNVTLFDYKELAIRRVDNITDLDGEELLGYRLQSDGAPDTIPKAFHLKKRLATSRTTELPFRGCFPPTISMQNMTTGKNAAGLLS